MVDLIDENQQLDISVIIPVRRLDEPDLRSCLNSLRRQSIVGDVEVIAVEGGNIAQARNEGIRISKGRYVAFIDSDCVAPENWLSIMLSEINEVKDSGAVGGIGVSFNIKDRFSKSLDIIFRSYLGSLGSASLYHPSKTKVVGSLSTSNSIYSKELLREVGEFDERYTLNEDTEFNARVVSKGYKLYLNPKSFVYHRRPETLSSYSKKFYRWGVSRMQAMLTDNKLIDIKIITLFLCTLILPFILSINSIQLLTFLSAYTVLLASHGFYYSYQKRDPLLILYLPILYFILHFSYWLGLLRGLVNGKYHDTRSYVAFKIHSETLSFEEILEKQLN